MKTGDSQETTDIPPHSHLKGLDMKEEDGKSGAKPRSFDDCRGLGGSCSIPTSSVGMSDVLFLDLSGFWLQSSAPNCTTSVSLCDGIVDAE